MKNQPPINTCRHKIQHILELTLNVLGAKRKMKETLKNIIKRCVQHSHQERLLETCLQTSRKIIDISYFFRAITQNCYLVKNFLKKRDYRDEIQKLLQVEVVQKHKNQEPAISDKNCVLPSLFIQCWCQIGSSFLVFIASHGFFRIDTTLNQEEGHSG